MSGLQWRCESGDCPAGYINEGVAYYVCSNGHVHCAVCCSREGRRQAGGGVFGWLWGTFVDWECPSCTSHQLRCIYRPTTG